MLSVRRAAPSLRAAQTDLFVGLAVLAPHVAKTIPSGAYFDAT